VSVEVNPNYPSDLDASIPTASDLKAEGDDNIRNCKRVFKITWPNVSGAINASHTEHNYLVGVTSPIQTQFGMKGAITGQVWTGTHDFTGATPTVPTATTGDSTTKAASTAFVAATAFASALPAQTGNANKFVTTNGTTASWSQVPLTTGVSGTLPVTNGGLGAATFTDGGVLIGNGTGIVQVTSAGTSGQALVSNGAGVDPTFQTLTPSALVLLSTVTASGAATADIETTFDSTYDEYIITASGVVPSSDGISMTVQMKLGGAYDTGANYHYHSSKLASNAATYAATQSDAASSISMNVAQGNSAGRALSFTMRVHRPADTTVFKSIDWTGSTISNTGLLGSLVGAGFNSGATTALTGIRIAPGSGTISGTFRLYGIKNS
jgi:hypothetical protein